MQKATPEAVTNCPGSGWRAMGDWENSSMSARLL
jgi:hypothetical protein